MWKWDADALRFSGWCVDDVPDPKGGVRGMIPGKQKGAHAWQRRSVGHRQRLGGINGAINSIIRKKYKESR